MRQEIREPYQSVLEGQGNQLGENLQLCGAPCGDCWAQGLFFSGSIAGLVFTLCSLLVLSFSLVAIWQLFMGEVVGRQWLVFRL